MKQAHRFSGPGKPYEGLTKQTKAGPQWTGVVRPVEDVLLEPLSWRKPRRVFVNSMSDLFHEDVPFEFIDKVFAVMALCPQHTFQVLTKRADRMHDYLTKASEADDITVAKFEITGEAWDFFHSPRVDLPLPNVWLGVSVENQQYADERIPLLLQTPAAIRFISAEPLLDHLNICPWIEADWSPSLHWWKWSPVKPKPVIDWVICSGESGPGARVCRPHWFRNIVGPCKASKTTKVFVKQLGSHIITRNDDGWEGDTPRSWPMDTAYDEDLSGFRDGYQGAPVRVRLKDRKGGDPSEWPEDLRVREFPA
jgi:protein gp37